MEIIKVSFYDTKQIRKMFGCCRNTVYSIKRFIKDHPDIYGLGQVSNKWVSVQAFHHAYTFRGNILAGDPFPEFKHILYREVINE